MYKLMRKMEKRIELTDFQLDGINVCAPVIIHIAGRRYKGQLNGTIDLDSLEEATS